MKLKFDINNVLYIGILILIILLVCLKCISIQKNIQENFAGHEEKSDAAKEVSDAEDILKTNAALGSINNKSESNDKNRDSDDVENMTAQEKAELRRKCAALEDKAWGSVVSKYSGKTINVENIGERDGEKVYIIKWQPLGGKPGGCITLEANGTYSTPICNPNIDKQKWIIKKITSEKIHKEVIPKDRQSMGRPMEETAYPFYMILSAQDKNYVLNYEGGGISIRLSANYDGQKWDVSENKIPQDPLPTQKNSKFTGLTPGHNLSQTDKSMASIMGNGMQNIGGNDSSGNGNGKGAVNLNVNLDPDLLARLGLGLGPDGNLQNLNDPSMINNTSMGNNKTSSGNNKDSKEDFFVGKGSNSTGGRGDISEMLVGGQNNPNCEDCDKIPENYIKKDLVKSMCIGCDNIDNVLT